jgi:hypothetical protein
LAFGSALVAYQSRELLGEALGSMSQQVATVLGALITSSIALTVGVLAYVFGRLQKEHEVRFAWLYERQAEITVELYTYLQGLLDRFTDWRDFHEQGREDARDTQNQPIRETLDKFHEVLSMKEIWMSEDTVKRLRGFYEEVDYQWYDAALPAEEGRTQEIAGSVYGWVGNALPTLIRDLKSEFRATLGIRDESERHVILGPKARIAVGWLGSSLIGLGLSGAFGGLLYNYLEHPLGKWWVFLLSGLAVGLGLGMLLEYLRPSRHR